MHVNVGFGLRSDVNVTIINILPVIHIRHIDYIQIQATLGPSLTPTGPARFEFLCLN